MEPNKTTQSSMEDKTYYRPIATPILIESSPRLIKSQILLGIVPENEFPFNLITFKLV